MQYVQYVWFGVIGLVAGTLAGLLLRGHHNVLVDIVLGVAGAVVGAHLFLTYGTGLAPAKMGSLVFAAIGAGVFLLAWRTSHWSD